MFSRLLSAVLLITLLNTQRMYAYPPPGNGNQFYGEPPQGAYINRWDQPHSERYHQHGPHHHHHHEFSHGQHLGNNPYYGGNYPAQPFQPGMNNQLPSFGRPHAGGPGGGYPIWQRPNNPFVGQRNPPYPNGNNNGPPFGSQPWGSDGHSGGGQFGQGVGQPNPNVNNNGAPFEGQQPGDESQFGNQQPAGGSDSTFPPRPNGQNGGHQPGQGVGQPNLNVNNNGAPFGQQPGDESQFDFQQPAGGADANIQPLPINGPAFGSQQPGDDNLFGFRQPAGGSDSTFQPRPQGQNGNRQASGQFGGQQPGDDNFFGFQQPAPGGADDTFQSGNGPTSGNAQAVGHNLLEGQQSIGDFQQPSDDASPTTSRTNENAKPLDFSDIFNTNDFVSPTLSGSEGHLRFSDPKSDAEQVKPNSIDDRNIFDTLPVCRPGTEINGGRCRKAA